MIRSFPLLCLVAGVAPGAWAQTSVTADPEVISHEAPAIFSTRVNLVSVPVVVRDKDGRVVSGLRQEDFQLLDKGKQQIITKFTIQTGIQTGIQTSEAARSSLESAAKTSATTATTAAAATQPELPDRYVAYVFDDIHMQAADLLQARRAAARHLDTALDSRTSAGIFTTSGRTTQGFTQDSAKLHAAVDNIRFWESVGDKTQCLQISYYIADYLINQEVSLSPFGVNPGSSLGSAMLTAAGLCNTVDPLRLLWQTANASLLHGQTETASALSVLGDLVNRMSAMPGSRTIVLVSPGFLLSPEHRAKESLDLDAAIRANVVVNSLDIRGVDTPMRASTFNPEYGGKFGGPANAEVGVALMNADRDEMFRTGDVLAELAYGTGGTVHKDNDFEAGLKELAARPETVYVLGYSPDNLKSDGSYHALKVKLREPARFDAEARRGYWAPNHAIDPAEAATEELKETLFSRDEIADIPLDLHAEFFKPDNKNAEISVVAHLDVKGVRLKKAGDRNDDTLTIVTGLFDQNGNYISGIQRVVELRLRDPSLQVLQNSGIRVEQSFSVPPGRYIVRAVVKDSEGHTTAARNTGIEVP